MYEQWKNDSSKVHKSWDTFFKLTSSDKMVNDCYVSPFSINNLTTKISPQPISENVDDHLAVYSLIRAYQIFGHLKSTLDPLGITVQKVPYELTLKRWGLDEKDLDKVFHLPSITHIGGSDQVLSLKEIVARLENAYCMNIGVEVTSLRTEEQIDWLKKQFESPNNHSVSNNDKIILLNRLIRSSMFEEFLAKKYPSEKRFGLEGCEVLIPALKEIIDNSCRLGVEDFIMGMPHRGRLNVLANVCRQPLSHLFSQFNADLLPDEEGSGDVKYHLGMSHQFLNRANNKNVNIAILANPSHLEAVDPVVEGKTCAKQFFQKDLNGKKSMSILLHGDAAFAGQGVVYETFHLSDLPNYTTHGTIHIVVNNQIGFTTDPRVARSSRYCTDVAKVVNAPIFHVNSDDPESVIKSCRIASEYRQMFGKDVVIDLVCYRRFGHNESDNPSFTQPLMYKTISNKEHVLSIYSSHLLNKKLIDKDSIDDYKSKYTQILETDFQAARSSNKLSSIVWLDSKWEGFHPSNISEALSIPDTNVQLDKLDKIATIINSYPEDFSIHPGLKKILQQRLSLYQQGIVDWSMGEALSFGSLLLDGYHVRLSGQDVERGTFSHRHAVLHDYQKDMLAYVPLNNLQHDQSHLTVCNSSLSEYAVLGFEYGYSLENPKALVCWEAQFGDFSNTAQCIIDQFISSGQDKWRRQSGLVLLLPHGYEGMGPEHSSARPERFLQMCSEDSSYMKIPMNKRLYRSNMIITNISTSANYFHALRRQMFFKFRKPLINMAPKSLLRLEAARSNIKEFTSGSFKPLLEESGEASNNPSNVTKLIFCSGKIYYDLYKLREDKKLTDRIAISRIEQLSPFPFDEVKRECEKFKNSKEVIWCQEEHKNQGYYSFVEPRLTNFLQNKTLKYIGRNTAAATSTGLKKVHYAEQNIIVEQAINID